MVIMEDLNMNNSDKRSKRTSKGRQKVEIKELQNKSSKQVTFSKRRGGLFKKASELCILCGAEIGIIAFSPNGKAFTFGHPDIDAIIDRYLSENNNPSEQEGISRSSSLPLSLQQLNREYDEALEELQEEKKRARAKVENKEGKSTSSEVFWWDEPVDGLGLEELEEYVQAMQELRKNLINRAQELVLMEDAMAASSTAATHPFVFGK